MVDEVKIGDEVKLHNGLKMYVTYIEYSPLDGCNWYNGIEANGKAHIAVKSFLCNPTGNHSKLIAEWVSSSEKNIDYDAEYKICRKCGRIAYWNSYFKMYLCSYCGWNYRLCDARIE